MDEPTNNLGVPEQHKVLELIRRMRDQGVQVVLITHTMPDVFAVADRIIVMHRGRKVTEKRTADTDAAEPGAIHGRRASTTRVSQPEARPMFATYPPRYREGKEQKTRPASLRAFVLFVAVHLLATLVHFLGFQGERGDGPGIEAGDANRIAGFLAVAVGAILDPLERGVDLADQLALAVAGAKLESLVAFGRGPIGHVRVVLAFFLEVLESFAALAEDILLPALQLLAEVLADAGS